MNTRPAAMLLCAITVLIGSTARAQDEPTPAPTPALSSDRATLSLQAAAEQPVDAPPERVRLKYLQKDSWNFTLGISGADNLGDMSDVSVYGAYGVFIEPRIEFIAEASIRYFNQTGNNAVGFNPGVVFRYHFWKSDEDATWTIFAEIGIGVMLTNDDVPDAGSSFNFTPRAGVGITRALTENVRLQAGLRWSHISNGRLWGDDDNPGSDSPLLFVGVSWVY